MARKPRMSKAEKLRRGIERWERKQEEAIITLRRSAEELMKLRRQNRRLLERETVAHHERKRRELSHPPVADDEGKAAHPPESSRDESVTAPEGEVKPQDDGIPKFLRRDLNALPDPRTKEKKAERRAIEREKRDADLTGKTRKMPPMGKEALRAIRESR